MAIVFGNILDTIPGCLVIGAKFTAIGNLSLTLMLGMFLGGIPEAAASASMLTKAGYRPAAIFGLWSTVLLAGLLAAAAGKAFIGSSDALAAIFAQALAGGQHGGIPGLVGGSRGAEEDAELVSRSVRGAVDAGHGAEGGHGDGLALQRGLREEAVERLGQVLRRGLGHEAGPHRPLQGRAREGADEGDDGGRVVAHGEARGAAHGQREETIHYAGENRQQSARNNHACHD